MDVSDLLHPVLLPYYLPPLPYYYYYHRPTSALVQHRHHHHHHYYHHHHHHHHFGECYCKFAPCPWVVLLPLVRDLIQTFVTYKDYYYE